eukprot:TRINITY_DN16204_c0_g1_i2.p1 TRINITY_DN16204_c0_g1~~TRINITY_DN16204_c0_g1_i2.p1  ORF type:complete len:234 (+),score=47.83 TRINITY_DN16204_c0_g1_i2:680-1381(+)
MHGRPIMQYGGSQQYGFGSQPPSASAYGMQSQQLGGGFGFGAGGDPFGAGGFNALPASVKWQQESQQYALQQRQQQHGGDNKKHCYQCGGPWPCRQLTCPRGKPLPPNREPKEKRLEQLKTWSKQVLCCFYLQGNCKYQENCNYSHEDRGNNPCHFGLACKMGHEKRKNNPKKEPEEIKDKPTEEATEEPAAETAETTETPAEEGAPVAKEAETAAATTEEKEEEKEPSTEAQ